MFKVVGAVLFDLVFPKFCCGCSRMDTYLCGECFNKIDLLSRPLTLQLEDQVISEFRAVAYYDEVIRNVIHTYKYEFVQGIGQALARFIYYTTILPKVDYITAVPLHPKRQRERGFNQAEVIASELSKLSLLPFLPLLQRTAFKTAQAKTKSRTDRTENIKGQFHIIDSSKNVDLQSAALSFDPPSLTNKSILIIDDVCTTGATLNECARVLLAAGAKSVEGLVVAHGS